MTTGYTTRQVADTLGLSPRQVRHMARTYVRAGLLSPARGRRNEYRFAFHDIVVLRTARALRESGLGPGKVRRALARLREQLPAGRPLSAVRVSAAGDRVLVRDRETLWEPESGQVHFDFSVSELADRVAPFARAAADRRLDEPGRPSMAADDWYDLAFDLEAVAPARAAQAYRRAIALNPGHPEAHLNLGRLLHEGGDLLEAESHYRQALAADPSNAMAAYNLGVVLEDRHREEEARAFYERAIEHDPGHAEAHFNLARLCEEAGDPASAVQHLSSYRRLTGEEQGRNG
ncbi:MAG TPA: tetratricopeptide repeat protein [Longimicrobiales bacterium]|nr:tetratricopeptide repeat protein [Longimicrobiales bacterium]